MVLRMLVQDTSESGECFGGVFFFFRFKRILLTERIGQDMKCFFEEEKIKRTEVRIIIWKKKDQETRCAL